VLASNVSAVLAVQPNAIRHTSHGIFVRRTHEM
jgi:hypothetical protein